MSKVWREIADPNKHSDFMNNHSEQGIPISKSRDNLVEKWVYLVEVCNFTFQFADLEQVKACKSYFEQKVHPSTIRNHPPHEHYWQPWYCKLPKGITREGKRQKVIKALTQILDKWEPSP
ncbi:hypothetical protein SG34_032130 [Thalassomonas viridans]|uniref:Uncharacterized protein n=1 Tax=Thalassomonas viridans TaxID=137584 RepID=A0AAE9ZC95_9GAMM|nr:hypothetical protein [Thalassomonas viridans]WDE08573.1 hypothetical protein SG34_032130 [Thalassomonas viridans]